MAPGKRPGLPRRARSAPNSWHCFCRIPTIPYWVGKSTVSASERADFPWVMEAVALLKGPRFLDPMSPGQERRHGWCLPKILARRVNPRPVFSPEGWKAQRAERKVRVAEVGRSGKEREWRPAGTRWVEPHRGCFFRPRGAAGPQVTPRLPRQQGQIHAIGILRAFGAARPQPLSLRASAGSPAVTPSAAPAVLPAGAGSAGRPVLPPACRRRASAHGTGAAFPPP